MFDNGDGIDVWRQLIPRRGAQSSKIFDWLQVPLHRMKVPRRFAVSINMLVGFLVSVRYSRVTRGNPVS